MWRAQDETKRELERLRRSWTVLVRPHAVRTRRKLVTHIHRCVLSPTVHLLVNIPQVTRPTTGKRVKESWIARRVLLSEQFIGPARKRPIICPVRLLESTPIRGSSSLLSPLSHYCLPKTIIGFRREVGSAKTGRLGDIRSSDIVGDPTEIVRRRLQRALHFP